MAAPHTTRAVVQWPSADVWYLLLRGTPFVVRASPYACHVHVSRPGSPLTHDIHTHPPLSFAANRASYTRAMFACLVLVAR
eukprot:5526000-Prymnesium_polylepis.1